MTILVGALLFCIIFVPLGVIVSLDQGNLVLFTKLSTEKGVGLSIGDNATVV